MSTNSSDQKFHGKIRGEQAVVAGRAQGKERLTDVAGFVDLFRIVRLQFEAAAKNQGAVLQASGTLAGDRQIVNAKVDSINLLDYLPLIPDGLL